MSLRVNEIFESISGEAGGFPQGTWCTFIRLQGCNLTCAWCDTEKAQDSENLCYKMEISDIMDMVQNRHVLITGGEPLLQEGVSKLIWELTFRGKVVQIETNGSLLIPYCDFPDVYASQLHWVVDRKTPSSKMHENMLRLETLADQIKNMKQKGQSVYLKWVVADYQDIYFAIREIKELAQDWHGLVPFLISPVDANGSMIKEIVEEIKDENPWLLEFVTFSVQLHKICKMP